MLRILFAESSRRLLKLRSLRTSFDLPRRARRALEGHGLTTAGALAAKKGLRELKRIGRKTVEEIEMQLWPMGLQLDGEG